MAGLFSTILVPTDGSDDAIMAAQVATDLARRTGSAIHLAHAWQFVTYAGDPYLSPGALPDGYLTMYEDAGRAMLEQESARVASLGATVAGIHLLQGRPADTMVDLAGEIGADLIVAGSRGLGPLRRLVLGSVSDGIAHHAPCPVLLVRGGAGAWPPQRVIVGDDGSPAAERAAQLAAQIAAFYKANGVVVRGYQPVLTPDLDQPGGPRRHDELIEAAEIAIAERAAELAAAFGSRPEPRLGIGDPADLLVTAGESVDVPALIAVGSRGLGAFQRFRLGSTSTKVLHAAHCPVLVVPGKHAADEQGTA
jgi:nucleotide-binding universal stress UspA family protein